MRSLTFNEISCISGGDAANASIKHKIAANVIVYSLLLPPIAMLCSYLTVGLNAWGIAGLITITPTLITAGGILLCCCVN